MPVGSDAFDDVDAAAVEIQDLATGNEILLLTLLVCQAAAAVAAVVAAAVAAVGRLAQDESCQLSAVTDNPVAAAGGGDSSDVGGCGGESCAGTGWKEKKEAAHLLGTAADTAAAAADLRTEEVYCGPDPSLQTGVASHLL